MTSTHPRTAKTFTANWETPELEHLINGSCDIPNIHQRQNCLVGQTLDACVVLHVYEELKDGSHFDSLKPFFPKKFSEKQFSELANAPDEKKLTMLVEMVQNKNPAKRLLSHRDLIQDKEWNKYTKAFQDYVVELNLRHEIKKKNYEHDLEVELPDLPTMPADPRITAVNDRIKPTIQLVSSGPKEEPAIKAKVQRKNANVRELRDVNRVEVLPVRFEYAQDLIKIIQLLNPPKLVHGHEIPRVFEEQAEVSSTGYFNQKIFVALDKCADRENATKGNVAVVTEIKIVPAEMLEADKLTATTKPIIDKLGSTIKYTSDKPEDSTEIKLNRRILEVSYAEQKKAFEKLVGENNAGYEFPKLNKQHMDDPKTYEKLRSDFHELTTRIHVDAIMKENRTWKEEYLKREKIQELSGDPDKKEKINHHLPTDITRTDRLDESWLKEIAKSGNLDLKSIEKSVKSEMGLQRAKHQAQR